MGIKMKICPALCEYPIDWDTPAWHSGLRFSECAATIGCRPFRVCAFIDMNTFAQGIDIPHDLRAGGKIVNSFIGHLNLGSFAVIALAANFRREGGRSFDEAH